MAVDLPKLSALELVDLFAESSRQRGVYSTKAMDARGDATRKKSWAMYRRSEDTFNAARIELFKRMGVPLTGEAANRPSFILLAAAKANRLCEECGTTGGFRGKLLGFWTEEGCPLPLVQALNGAGKEQVRNALDKCKCLCPKCAKKLTGGKAKFTMTGKPDCSEWM